MTCDVDIVGLLLFRSRFGLHCVCFALALALLTAMAEAAPASGNLPGSDSLSSSAESSVVSSAGLQAGASGGTLAQKVAPADPRFPLCAGLAMAGPGHEAVADLFGNLVTDSYGNVEAVKMARDAYNSRQLACLSSLFVAVRACSHEPI